MQVCISDISSAEVRVAAHAWDSALGGRKLDELLTAVFAQTFYAQHGHNIAADPKPYSSMMKAVQKMRRTLTTVEEAHRTSWERLTSGAHHAPDFQSLCRFVWYTSVHSVKLFCCSLDLTRKQFEQITDAAMKRIGEVCQEALMKAQEQSTQIYAVELVVSTARTPVIEKIVGNVFKQPVKRSGSSLSEGDPLSSCI